MKKIVLTTATISIYLVACSNSSKSTETTNPVQTEQQTETTQTENTSNESTDGDVLSLFSDFPKMATKSKPTEHILIPAYKMLENYANGKTTSLIFYNAKMATPGDQNSKVAFTFDGEQEVPNHLIIPIEAGTKVKNGDIVLTWWQSGSGMQRAIVTNASNPTAPEVHYLDIDWNNPAKNSGVGIGQLKEKIKENTFCKITDSWQPGTTVAIQEGTSMKKYTVINVNEDKVLARGFAGSMKVLDKAKCTALKVNPKFKVGDKIQAPWVGSFKAGVIKEIKAEYGRAVVVFDHDASKEHVIPFGDITTGLIL